MLRRKFGATFGPDYLQRFDVPTRYFVEITCKDPLVDAKERRDLVSKQTTILTSAFKLVQYRGTESVCASIPIESKKEIISITVAPRIHTHTYTYMHDL